MEYLTQNEARRYDRLWRNMHAKLRIASSGYNSNYNEVNETLKWRLRPGTNPRNQRVLNRNAMRAKQAFHAYNKELRDRHHMTVRNIVKNFNEYLRLQFTARNVVGAKLVGRSNTNYSLKNTINALTENGLSRENATRLVLRNLANKGARVAVAVRTLQRAFRAKRAAKKQGIHVEMRGLRNVPVSGIRLNNGNIRPLKPSDIKAARQYLAAQGFRASVRRTPRRTI